MYENAQLILCARWLWDAIQRVTLEPLGLSPSVVVAPYQTGTEYAAKTPAKSILGDFVVLLPINALGSGDPNSTWPHRRHARTCAADGPETAIWEA